MIRCGECGGTGEIVNDGPHSVCGDCDGTGLASEPIEETILERTDWPGAKPKQAAFLSAYVYLSCVVRAAKAAKIARCLHYQWLDADQNYEKLFQLARRMGADALEGEAILQAKLGAHGLMQFLLRGLKPDTYREKVEHSGPNGGPIDASITVSFVKPA